MLDLTIIVPAYNEEERIHAMLMDYQRTLSSQTYFSWEIVVALNGCRDLTEEIVLKTTESESRIRYHKNDHPVGKGGAIKEGIEMARPSRLIGFTDADGSTPADSFLKIAHYAENCEIAIGSRWLKSSQVMKPQTMRRRILSRVFNTVVNGLFFFGVKDTQCGAKVFKADWVKPNIDQLILTDMAFDVNLLFLIKKSGGRIVEVPTCWEDKEGSKVRIFRTSLSMTLSVLRLRWIHSPLNFLRRPFRKLEIWLYKKLG
ncbi:MAG: glycosyltransferase [Puniceicoccales bacterium]